MSDAMGDSDKALREVLARNVERLRTTAGWSQQDLADHSDVAVRYVGAIERAEANVSLKVLAKLSSAFAVSAVELLNAE